MHTSSCTPEMFRVYVVCCPGQVLEGPHVNHADQNHLLGEIILTGITPKLKDTSVLKARLDIDSNGQVTIAAWEEGGEISETNHIKHACIHASTCM